MEKRALLLVTVFLLIFITSLAISQDHITEDEKIDMAYECLENKVDGECSSLSSEEKIFSLLAINECESEVINDSSNDRECWPSANCKLKTTAQAVLALDNSNSDTSKAESWLLSQNRTPTELDWFLQIESSGSSTCSITYSSSSFSVNIGEDRKIDNNAGNCLTLAQNDYWLRITPSCYNEEFEVSCDQTFLTTLLFKKITSPTIHVSEKTSSAAAGGTTTEKVNSFCFSEGNSCNYEGSLWAALVLDSLGRDVSPYLPYLITIADQNQRFLPEAFLYSLTANTDFRNSVLSKQKSNKWWVESGDKFYDTALVLYQFQQDVIQEKTDAKSWLLDVQDSEGCWEGNIRNTAFLLTSIWPRSFSGSSEGPGEGGGGGGLPDCENAGYYCMSGASCEGDILSEFECPTLLRCCNLPNVLETTCSEINGVICASNEICSGTRISASDVSDCCIQGNCEIIDGVGRVSDCEFNDGTCRPYGCGANEEEASYSCDYSGDSCCISEFNGGGDIGKSYAWVWVLLILIILVVVGIIFRNKLKDFWLKMRSGRRPRPGKPFGRPMPGPMQPMMHRRPIQRRILPPVRNQPIGRPRRAKTSKELDDVLKKLKSMGNK